MAVMDKKLEKTFDQESKIFGKSAKSSRPWDTLGLTNTINFEGSTCFIAYSYMCPGECEVFVGLQ